MLKLQIPVNSKGDIFEFNLAKEKVTIGRRHDNDIRIKETYVSAYHAELSQGEDGRIFLKDRDSSNGTFLNGKRVIEPVQVFRGDILKFGSIKCSIEEVIDKLKDAAAMGIEDSALARSIHNKTAAVSAKRAAETIIDQRNTKPVSPNCKTASLSFRAPGSITSGTFTSRSSDDSQSFDTETEHLSAIGLSDTKPDFRELKMLKNQLELKKNELRKARDELKAISEELNKTKRKAADEDAQKLQRIAELEKRLKKNEAGNGKLEHRVRLANNRAEQLASELEHHKTDMSAEIKAAMQRLTHTKNDKVLLENTLKALEQERNQFRDQSLSLSKKLEKTREGFSLLLQKSADRLQEESEMRVDIELDGRKAAAQLKELELELESVGQDFRKMEAGYRRKLQDAEELQARSRKSEQILIKDLELANEELKSQKADMVRLESSLKSLEAEKEAAEEDWSSRVSELSLKNRKLVDNSGELELLEERLHNSREEVGSLRKEKSYLEEETHSLRDEKKCLAAETKKIFGEKERSTAAINKVKSESQRASRKLDEILLNLHESEKKVSYLRNLENELEKSVLRAQRSALSRKGIYREDEEELTTIWPETEQLICRELIDRLEMLEDLLKRYQQSWFFPKVADQLNLLRDSFMTLLKNHSVDQFDLEPGTELSVDSRKKIQLISVDDLEDPKLKRLSSVKKEGSRTKVIQTLRPGYIYSKGGQDVIIRKAEVVVA